MDYGPHSKPLRNHDLRKSVPAPAVYVRLLLDRFGSTPELRQRLLLGTDVDENRIQLPGAEVSLFSFISFGKNLIDVVGEEWPLESFRIWTTPTHGALEVAARSAPTIGDGLQILQEYGHVRGPYLILDLYRTRKATALRFSTSIASCFETAKALSTTAMLSAVAMLEPMLESPSDDIEIRFHWGVPRSHERMVKMIAQRMSFNQPHCELVLPNHVCARASPYLDQSLLKAALASLDQDARRLREANNLALQIDNLLNICSGGRMSAQEVARQLAVSRRTLVRRLAEHGMTFRTIQDQNLKLRAFKMLKDGKLTRSQMAERLGFQDPTSFSRACRRWFQAD
ncbi:AraC family transcriptional regulator [Phyllobacterium salinisoli]|nr:AraC family transcriptional regulator ligand-binding domain-containing protein [Phyllobacterium salinisoli]